MQQKMDIKMFLTKQSLTLFMALERSIITPHSTQFRKKSTLKLVLE